LLNSPEFFSPDIIQGKTFKNKFSFKLVLNRTRELFLEGGSLDLARFCRFKKGIRTKPERK
jgi:hypothetical protein